MARKYNYELNTGTSGQTSGGIGFIGALTLLFIGLKLGGVVNWSWFWVLSPMIFSFSFAMVIILLALILLAFDA